ncbi:MAG TPA: hypothetical protein VFO86_02495, partial [Terriglobia bacterium]|nr:hypothetical protein [Terriglobia bacterium]
VASGLTMAIRVGGLIVVCYLGLFTAIWFAYSLFFRRKTAQLTSSFTLRLSGIIAAISASAYAIMLLFWPYGSSKPFVRPFVALHWLSHVTATVATWDYIPRHLLLKLPEVILLFILVAIGFGFRELMRYPKYGDFPETLSYLLLIFSVLFPVCYAIAVGPYLYDEIRHFLFIVPPLICIVAIALNRSLDWLLTKPVLGQVAFAALAVYFVLQVRIMTMLHPYEYTYFNRLIGGMAGAARNGYESEYWATSYKEGVEKLKKYLLARDGTAFDRTEYRILVGNADWCATYYFPENFKKVAEASQADIYLTTTRWEGAREHSGPVIVDVQRLGIPFIVAKSMTAQAAK